jgi:rRNA maturation RNase YbeY
MKTPKELNIRNMTRRITPVFPFDKAHQTVLKSFEVSLAFVTSTEAVRVNKALRKKTYPPPVLSYVTGDKSGEVLICLEEAKKQAPEFGLSYPNFVGFLFIHALLHLEGRQHGTTMERTEEALFKRVTGIPYPSNETPHSDRNRHRDASSKDRRR